MTTSYLQGLPTRRQDPLDPPKEIAELRETAPIARMTFPDGHNGWLITSHQGVRAVLASPVFSARIENLHSPIPREGLKELQFKVPPGMFSRMDPPDHTRIRRMLTGQFTVRRMNLLEPRIAEIAERLLDELDGMDQPVDLVQAYTLPLPSLVICELLGVAYEHRERFQRDAAQLVDLEARTDTVMTAWGSMMGLLAEIVNAKRAEPGDDLISGLLAENELTHEELVTISMVLLFAGHETTANMLALGTYTLLNRPQQIPALLADPAGAVEELLRYLSIIHIGPVRTALEDVEIEGQLIKAGECVAMSVPGANRDRTKFGENADELDVSRHAHGHVAFGHGIHQCLGQQLARIEMRIGYAALFRRFPALRVAGEVRFRDKMSIYGLHTLPVSWDKAVPESSP